MAFSPFRVLLFSAGLSTDDANPDAGSLGSFCLSRLQLFAHMKTEKSLWYLLAILVLGLSFVALSGCASSGVGVIPPVTQQPTGQEKTGKFVWFDLLTDDVEAAKRFYGGLFGWRFEATDHPRYTLVKRGGKPIAGIVAAKEGSAKQSGGRWLASLSVPDVAAAVDLVRAKGGAVHEGPEMVAGRGVMAIVSDPQGAQLILLRSRNGDPVDAHPSFNEWMWIELWTHDKEAAVDFYRALAGYEGTVIGDGGGGRYQLLLRDGIPRAGVVQLPWSDVRPTWAPYVRVADPAAIAKKAKALGGRVFLDPSPDFEKGTIAIIVDPTGGVVIVQRWSGLAFRGGAPK